MVQKTVFSALTLLFSALAPSTANEARGQFNDWRLFVEGENQTRNCYIASEPKRSTPKKAKRGDVFMTIAHRPGQGVRNEISVRVGYPFSPTSEPFARVGSDEFGFFTGVEVQNGAEEWAWLDKIQDQERLMKAMKRGNELIFKATSARGTLTTDSYSLKGVTAAMKALDAACPAP